MGSLPLTALAWGEHGHQIIAKLAEERLSPAAKEEITRLLGTTDLASISNWADTIKFKIMPETYNWHFVNIPRAAHDFEPMRDCLNDRRGYCAIAALDTMYSDLRDRTTPFEQKVKDLKIYVHVMGDIAQPFHCIDDDDRGGYNVSVAFLGNKVFKVQDWERPYNLHLVWDDALVNHRGLTVDEYVKRLDLWLKKQSVKKLTKGTVIDWVLTAHEIAIQQYVNQGANLDESYVDQASAIADRQLALAGVRLAYMLNKIFGK
jgi:hypothetical protein